MSFDIQLARADTPGCNNVIHLNNAGAALPPKPVLDAVIGHLELEASIGGYEAAESAADEVSATYGSIAALINADRDEIALLENATRAWDMAFYGLSFKPGDRILTARAEYASNVIAFLQVAKRTGAVVEFVPDDEHGQLSVSSLEEMLDDRVRLIAMTHVPSHNGLINPAAEVGEVARQAGITYLLDACQSVGQMAVDVRQIGCDMLAATGRKFLRGPRGTGFLFVRRGLIQEIEPPILDLHSATWTGPFEYATRTDATRFETWEKSYAGIIGLGAAVDYARSWGLDRIEQRVGDLAERLRGRLAAIDGLTLRDTGLRRSGIVTFTVEGIPASEVAAGLRANKANVSVAPGEYSRLDMESRGLKEVVRASVHYYNTEDELERFCGLIDRLRATNPTLRRA